jgi:hypothetical protein
MGVVPGDVGTLELWEMIFVHSRFTKTPENIRSGKEVVPVKRYSTRTFRQFGFMTSQFVPQLCASRLLCSYGVQQVCMPANEEQEKVQVSSEL